MVFSGLVTGTNPTAEKLLVSSLVITLVNDGERRATVLAQLAVFPGLELGRSEAGWLPAVLESADATRSIAALEAVPGVLFVEVVFVEVLSP